MITEYVDGYAKINYEKMNQIIEKFNAPRRCFITVTPSPNEKNNWIYKRFMQFERFKTPLSERKNTFLTATIGGGSIMATKIQQQVLDYLKIAEVAPLSEIYDHCNVNYYTNATKHFGALLSRMVLRGQLERVKKGVFRIAEKTQKLPEMKQAESLFEDIGERKWQVKQ